MSYLFCRQKMSLWIDFYYHLAKFNIYVFERSNSRIVGTSLYSKFIFSFSVTRYMVCLNGDSLVLIPISIIPLDFKEKLSIFYSLYLIPFGWGKLFSFIIFDCSTPLIKFSEVSNLIRALMKNSTFGKIGFYPLVIQGRSQNNFYVFTIN